ASQSSLELKIRHSDGHPAARKLRTRLQKNFERRRELVTQTSSKYLVPVSPRQSASSLFRSGSGRSATKRLSIRESSYRNSSKWVTVELSIVDNSATQRAQSSESMPWMVTPDFRLGTYTL